MSIYSLDFFGIKRELPIIQISPNFKVASVNLLGDVELVETATEKLCEKIKELEFDYLVGPEVKVVPLLQSMSKFLNKDRYIVCRKNIVGYMTSPIRSKSQTLVLDGRDANMLTHKKVIIVDDVVTSGKTISAIDDLMRQVNAQIVAICTVFTQGDEHLKLERKIIALMQLPLF